MKEQNPISRRHFFFASITSISLFSLSLKNIPIDLPVFVQKAKDSIDSNKKLILGRKLFTESNATKLTQEAYKMAQNMTNNNPVEDTDSYVNSLAKVYADYFDLDELQKIYDFQQSAVGLKHAQFRITKEHLDAYVRDASKFLNNPNIEITIKPEQQRSYELAMEIFEVSNKYSYYDTSMKTFEWHSNSNPSS